MMNIILKYGGLVENEEKKAKKAAAHKGTAYFQINSAVTGYYGLKCSQRHLLYP